MSASNDNKGSQYPLLDLTQPVTFIVMMEMPKLFRVLKVCGATGHAKFICQRDLRAAPPSANEGAYQRRKPSHLSIV